MHIAIRNVACIETVDIRVDRGITLCAARNHQGKSTILKMAAAALCGVAIPTSALKKKDAKAMVRRGAKNGFVRVTDEDGIVDISYPACDVTTEGRAPHASTLAVGRADLTTMNEQDRARALADLLKTEPSREDLASALADAGIAADMVEKVTATAWSLIETHSWDGAAKMAQENGAKLKGRWEQVTGENYGVDKARDWQPAALRLETSRPDLETAVAEATAALNSLVGATAVSAADREQMEALSATLADRQAEAETAEKVQQVAASAYEVVRKARDALPGTMTGGNAVCPCCDKPLFVKPNHGGGGGFRVEKAEPVSTADLQKRRNAFAAAEGELQRLTAEHASANRAHISAQAALKLAEDSKARLAKLGTAPVVDNAAAVAQARADVATAEAALRALNDKAQADDINASIGRTLAVVEALRPDGVRKAKLIKTLGGFNEALRAHTDIAGWKSITIAPDLEIEYAATPLFLCSESEMWRCRAALRLTIAKLQGSPIVILDGADVLDNPGRQGLFKMLMKAGVPALVAMTIDGPPGSQADPKSLVPDLAKHGIGASWWINAGVAEAIGETKAEAA